MEYAPTTQVTAPGDLEIRVTRTFEAPRNLVADAFTKPELLRRWLGVFEGWFWVECRVDLRVGGAYRWEWRNEDGMRLVLSGRFQEVVPGERYVLTQVYEDTPDFPGEMLVTLVLHEEDGRTTVEQTTRYATREERDRDLQQMPAGLEAGFANLDALLAEVRAG